MTSVAISTGPDTHLDHLAPLCSFLCIQLIVIEESHYSLCRIFYPEVDVLLLTPAELTLERLASYETLFYCGKFWALELLPLFQLQKLRAPLFVHVPHGNSDKEAELDAHTPQQFSLVYGTQMKKLTQGPTITIGNLRYLYYLQHKSHLDRLAQARALFKFSPEKTLFFYAPSWPTQANPTSFLEAAEPLIESISRDHQLLFKPHPLLEELYPAQFWRLIGRYEDHPSIQILTEFPAIYPLLERVDAYIGDHSSVGYDFLLYKKPMFFLPSGQKAYLHQCGEIVDPSRNWKTVEEGERKKRFFPIQEKIYSEAFEEKSAETLLKELAEKLKIKKSQL